MASSKILFVLVFYTVYCSIICRAQIEGDVRLTGLDLKIKSSGRLEIFLNGKWGTVSREISASTDAYLHLAYGKTVCYQINHYNGDNSKVATGTVSELNKALKDAGRNIVIDTNSTLNASVYDLKCENPDGEYPRHVLRCSYSESDGSRNHNNDLAVICSKSASNSDFPFVGQVRLVNDVEKRVSQGTLEIYGRFSWGNVCFDSFDEEAADAACRQLGYTNAKTLNFTSKRSASTVWLDSVTCGMNESQCLWHCLNESAYRDLYDGKSKSCIDDLYVTVACEFDILRKDETSPYIGRACQVPPHKGATTSAWNSPTTHHASTADGSDGSIYIIVGGVIGGFILLTLLVVCVAICLCCFLPSCYFYQQRTKKTRYTRVNATTNN